MSKVSSLTSKGQIVIPKQIRDQFGLRTRDRLQFSVDNGVIIAKPISTVEQFLGRFSGKSLSRGEMKTLIAKHYLAKHR
ncbi:MAG: AbrB/MazE/SpoVT family DNA-binding domain-containing protein [Candidatus Berkelbacteria bacterium]|nr:AbrB/MazE/SpoVT family DNA-binding domain-containing protein [Candidatus Berkelbacteria bacterium]